MGNHAVDSGIVVLGGKLRYNQKEQTSDTGDVVNTHTEINSSKQIWVYARKDSSDWSLSTTPVMPLKQRTFPPYMRQPCRSSMNLYPLRHNELSKHRSDQIMDLLWETA
jgi:hypothetical protein